MASDPWIQRFDERADEDERYYRAMARERIDRAREKASLDVPAALSAVPSPAPFPVDQQTRTAPHGRTTIDSMEGTIAAGIERVNIEALEPAVGPIDTKTWVAPPRRPRASLWTIVKRVIGWTAFFVAGWILALALAVTLIEVVAWFMDGP